MKPKKCKRCDYTWTPRNRDIKPKACPQCKRYDWDVKVSSAKMVFQDLKLALTEHDKGLKSMIDEEIARYPLLFQEAIQALTKLRNKI